MYTVFRWVFLCKAWFKNLYISESMRFREEVDGYILYINMHSLVELNVLHYFINKTRPNPVILKFKGNNFSNSPASAREFAVSWNIYS